MKKVYAFFVTLLILQCSFATTHLIEVSNFQFNPSTVNANVGDTMKWTWVSGFHTTSSTNVPAGAAAWDANIQGTGQTFSYKLTTAGTYTYQCNIHPSVMQGTINVSGVLPVVLNNFIISPAKLKAALISWSTATEQNTDHFEIMRSIDDKNFEKIVSVPAKGNSSVVTNYSYTDGAVPTTYRYIYYSLTIVDKDGKKTFSGIQMFRNANGSPKLIVSLGPNPITRPGHLLFQFNSEKNNSMHMQLFDPSGKLLKEADMTAAVGLNNGHFHMGDLAPGTYTVIFTMDAQKETYKIVMQ